MIDIDENRDGLWIFVISAALAIGSLFGLLGSVFA